ncbi:MAG: MFS transporter [Reyranellaceae bacterium]
MVGVRDDAAEVESPYAWWRLVACVALGALGGVGMWSVVVVLPTVQAEFQAARGDASLPYTMTMVGFAFGAVLMGRLVDRFGIARPMLGSALSLGLGYIVSSQTDSLWQFALVQGVMIGMLGSSTTFGPMMADISHFFTRRRGIAVALAASGNYLAGAFWPTVIQHGVETIGWRETHLYIGLFTIAAMLPLVLMLRRRPPRSAMVAPATAAAGRGSLGLSLGGLTALLALAQAACCVAMSMPQVHIVAYCNDLGYGVARGAEMLSVMLGLGIVSRIASGFVADRLGGLYTLLLGSTLQGLALSLYLVFDGMWSLYAVTALFGLVQGGIVPSYTMIVREYFPPAEAGQRVGLILLAGIFGMAGGGWLSGAIFDVSGSYSAAFVNGVAWNVLNVVIVVWLMMRAGRMRFALSS